jgi:hypothetical protein
VQIGGDDGKTFFIYEHLLSSSDFFNNALSKNWKEAQDRKISLPETDVEAFTIYAKWLFTGLLYTVKKNDDYMAHDSHESTTRRSHEWQRLRQCYVLGDFFQDVDFKDATIDAFLERIIETNSMPLCLAEIIYSKSLKNSPHRKPVQDLTVSCMNRATFGELNLPSMSSDFLTDVLVAVGSRLAQGIELQTVQAFLGEKGPCQYHEHTVRGTPCYKIRFTAKYRQI